MITYLLLLRKKQIEGNRFEKKDRAAMDQWLMALYPLNQIRFNLEHDSAALPLLPLWSVTC
jgi:hypothetical protein